MDCAASVDTALRMCGNECGFYGLTEGEVGIWLLVGWNM